VILWIYECNNTVVFCVSCTILLTVNNANGVAEHMQEHGIQSLGYNLRFNYHRRFCCLVCVGPQVTWVQVWYNRYLAFALSGGSLPGFTVIWRSVINSNHIVVEAAVVSVSPVQLADLEARWAEIQQKELR